VWKVTKRPEANGSGKREAGGVHVRMGAKKREENAAASAVSEYGQRTTERMVKTVVRRHENGARAMFQVSVRYSQGNQYGSNRVLRAYGKMTLALYAQTANEEATTHNAAANRGQRGEYGSPEGTAWYRKRVREVVACWQATCANGLQREGTGRNMAGEGAHRERRAAFQRGVPRGVPVTSKRKRGV